MFLVIKLLINLKMHYIYTNLKKNQFFPTVSRYENKE